MAGRYPLPMTKAMFPHRIVIQSVTARDVYGKATTINNKPLRCQVTPVTLSIMEQGGRAMRAGLSIKMPGLDTITDGTVLEWGGEHYTVTIITGKPDHQGVFHCWQVEAVKKRGD